MKSKSIIAQWDLVLVILGVIISLILFFLDIIPTDYILTLVISILGVIAFSQLRENIERDEQFRKIEQLYGKDKETKIISQENFYEILDDALFASISNVFLTHIDPFPTEQPTIPEKNSHFSKVKQAVKQRKNVVFRFMYTIPSDPKLKQMKLDWLRERVRYYQTSSNVSIRIIRMEASNKIPVLSVQVVDSAHIFIADLSSVTYTTPAVRIEYIWSNDTEFIKHFSSYCEILWANSEVIKEGGYIDWDLFKANA